MRYQVWERNKRQKTDRPAGIEVDDAAQAESLASWLNENTSRGWENYVVDTEAPPTATVENDTAVVLVGTVDGRPQMLGHWTSDWAETGLETMAKQMTHATDVHLARQTVTYERLR